MMKKMNRIVLSFVTIFLAVNFWHQAWSAPTIEGSLEASAYLYSAQPESLMGSNTYYRTYFNVAFDVAFTEQWNFHYNSRVTYRSRESESRDQWDLSFYYGYVDYRHSDKFSFELGRILDINNLVYLYFDGINVETSIPISSHKLTLDVYGGVVVNDDYLEEERLYSGGSGYNSTDYRNLFLQQRLGDYTGGLKASFLADKVGIFGLDYQVILNNNAIAEHYVSLDFETAFSKIVRLYGYGTLDVVELFPSNTLAAVQVNPHKKLSIVVSHEFFRPVMMKGSYFWSYFEPYGNQELSTTFMYFVNDSITMDVRYGVIFYDSEDTPGHDFTANLEHRDIFKFCLNFNNELITGPEGNRITTRAMLKRRVSILDIIFGGGVLFYNDDSLADGYSRGYFATAGTDINILKCLILSATGEYFTSPEYAYDIQGYFSLKYLF